LGWVCVFSWMEIHPWMEFSGHVITSCLTFKGTTKVFLKVAASFYIPTAMCERSHFHIFVNTYNYLFDCSDMKWYLTVVLICICLVTVIVHIFMCSLPIYISVWGKYLF
jgi:hypothetical protein